MIGTIAENKVPVAVITFISINVVDLLMRFQFSADSFLDYQPVLSLVDILTPDEYIVIYYLPISIELISPYPIIR